jgi:signal transduction histidine kinase
MTTEDNHRASEINKEMGELTRQKVVRQLHDGLAQTVSALAMRINYARRIITTDPAAAGDELEKVEGLTRAAAKEIRRIIFLLRPENQENFELCAELESYAEKLGELFDLEIEMDIDEELTSHLSKDVQNVIFGIVEELVDSAMMLEEKDRLVLSLNLANSDLDQIKFQDGNEGERKGGSFQGLVLSNIQSYASLIDGSVIIGKDESLVQILFPVTIYEGAGDSPV